MRQVVNLIEQTQQKFKDACTDCGSSPVVEEDAILQSVGEEYLPDHAQTVRDGGEPTVEYWEWLTEQTLQAQSEHDAEIAACHEADAEDARSAARHEMREDQY